MVRIQARSFSSAGRGVSAAKKAEPMLFTVGNCILPSGVCARCMGEDFGPRPWPHFVGVTGCLYIEFFHPLASCALNLLEGRKLTPYRSAWLAPSIA
jgi:hypothetical protein